MKNKPKVDYLVWWLEFESDSCIAQDIDVNGGIAFKETGGPYGMNLFYSLKTAQSAKKQVIQLLRKLSNESEEERCIKKKRRS